MKKLVAFYSRADENYFGGKIIPIKIGNTEILAKMIAEVSSAEIFKIEQKIPYAADYDGCVKEARTHRQTDARPELAKTLSSIDEYDEIYIGFPNYCGTMPMAVFTFLEQFDWTGKTIRPFITHEGSRFGTSLEDIKNICKGATISEGLAVYGSSVDDARKKVENWV